MEHKTADVNALSIKQLKALIGAAGLSTAGCVEKSDLRAKATEAQERLASVPSKGKIVYVKLPGGVPRALLTGDGHPRGGVRQPFRGLFKSGGPGNFLTGTFLSKCGQGRAKN